MKMNWGKGITLFLAAFIGFMGFLVYKTFQVDFDLVADDYYAQEIAYQDRIDAQHNLAAQQYEPLVRATDSGVSIEVAPSAMRGTGKVYFYDPTDKTGDRTFELQLDENGSMLVDYAALGAHRYQVKMSWEANGQQYFFETPIDL